jgi:hypothetical protein
VSPAVAGRVVGAEGASRTEHGGDGVQTFDTFTVYVIVPEPSCDAAVTGLTGARRTVQTRLPRLGSRGAENGRVRKSGAGTCPVQQAHLRRVGDWVYRDRNVSAHRVDVYADLVDIFVEVPGDFPVRGVHESVGE